MNCTGKSRSILLPAILYKPTAFRLLQPQLEQSSVILGFRLLQPQAMQPPQQYYTTRWRGVALGTLPGIFLPRRYFNTPLKRDIMRPIRGLPFAPSNRVLRQSWQHRMASTRSVIHFPRSYFGCFWKVTLAAAFINIAWSFVYHTFIVQIPYSSRTRFFQLETVPYTNRTHLVVRSPIDDHQYGDSCFAYIKHKHSSEILSPLHPDSVRVNRITANLVPAVQHGLAIKSNDASLVHVSPCKDVRLESKKHDKSCKTQPQTKHLDGLNWEAIVVKDDGLVGAMSLSNGKILVFTGLLNNLETDAEIAAIIAHEIAHVVARHWSESIIYEKWFPYPLKVYFLRRNELEADHIGMQVLAAAGIDPHIAPVAVEKLVGNDIFHPSGKKRAQLLSRPRCMEEAMELYREVIAAKAP